jgi:hypothetical protein
MVSAFTNETQASSYNVIEKFIAISRKVRAEAILRVLCTFMNIFGTQLAQNLRRVVEVCENSHEISEIVKRHLPQFFSQHFRTRSLTADGRPTTSLFIVKICSPIFEHSTALSSKLGSPP